MDYSMMNYGMMNYRTARYKPVKWSELSAGHKVLTVISFMISLAVVIMMGLKLSGHAVIPSAYIMAALGTVGVFQTAFEWGRDRGLACMWTAVAGLNGLLLALEMFV